MKFKAKIKSGLQTLKLKLAGGQKENTSGKEWTSPEIKKNAPLKENSTSTESVKNPVANVPDVLPKHAPNLKFNPDKSVTYSSGNETFDLSANAYRRYNGEQNIKLTPEEAKSVKRANDLEVVGMGNAKTAREEQGIPDFIQNDEQLKLWKEGKLSDFTSKKEGIAKMTEEAQANAKSPTELTRAIDRESGAREGFLAASVIGSTGAVGVGLGGLKAIGAGKALTSSAAAVPVMAATALLGLGKGEMAFRSKTRASDVSDAASAMIDSDKAMKKIMIAAKDPNSDMSQLIQAREDIKEYKYQAYKLAFEESYYDAKWGLSEGRQTILDYESWKGTLEAIEDEQFNSRLMAQNRDEYVNEMSAYLASEGNQ